MIYFISHLFSPSRGKPPTRAKFRYKPPTFFPNPVTEKPPAVIGFQPFRKNVLLCQRLAINPGAKWIPLETFIRPILKWPSAGNYNCFFGFQKLCVIKPLGPWEPSGHIPLSPALKIITCANNDSAAAVCDKLYLDVYRMITIGDHKPIFIRRKPPPSTQWRTRTKFGI